MRNQNALHCHISTRNTFTSGLTGFNCRKVGIPDTRMQGLFIARCIISLRCARTEARARQKLHLSICLLRLQTNRNNERRPLLTRLKLYLQTFGLPPQVNKPYAHHVTRRPLALGHYNLAIGNFG